MTILDTSAFDDALRGAGQLYLQCTQVVTIGGIAFDPQYQFEPLSYDGDFYPVAGLDEIVGDRPILTTTIKTFGDDALYAMHPGATIGDTLVTPAATLTRLTTGQYITGVAAIWPALGGGFHRVLFPVALVTKTPLDTTDKGEGTAKLTFEARASAVGQPRFYYARLDTYPYPCDAWASLTGWTLVRTIDGVDAPGVGTFDLSSGILSMHVNQNAGIALTGLAVLARTHTFDGLVPGAAYTITCSVSILSGSVGAGNQFGLTATGTASQSDNTTSSGTLGVTVTADGSGEIDVFIGLTANGLGQPVMEATFTKPVVARV